MSEMKDFNVEIEADSGDLVALEKVLEDLKNQSKANRHLTVRYGAQCAGVSELSSKSGIFLKSDMEKDKWLTKEKPAELT